MRCPDCQKFVPQEIGDIDTPDLELAYEETAAAITGEVRVYVVCGECGTELKEYTFEIDCSVDIPDGHHGEGHELSVECDGVEGTEDSRPPGRPARYQKHFYGAIVDFTVACECGELKDVSGEWSDDVQASSMDELT